MYGAVIGDIVGSKYEFRPIKTKDFPFVSQGCTFTDDTVMTVAVAKALLATCEETASGEKVPLGASFVREMRDLGRRYPNVGYGGRFMDWLWSDVPRPYNSFGNGSAMRVSPCGLIASSLEEAIALATASAEVTHDHPEGLRGAQAVAAAIYLAKTGRSKEGIDAFIRERYYALPQTVDEIRPAYSFDVTCQGSVPEAIVCFLESASFEDAVRNAVSLGGDADTQGAIAGSIAWAYYRFGRGFQENRERLTDRRPGHVWPEFCERIVGGYGIDDMLPAEFVAVIDEFDAAVERTCNAGS